MAFATSASLRDSVAEINITPLVDVMLVLLVIFMIAAPVVTQRIDIDLPGVAPTALPAAPPPPIELRIDAAGQLYWNDSPTPVSALPAMLEAERLRSDGDRSPQRVPTLQIDASGEADYGTVAWVLAAARNADWPRIGLVRK